MNTDILQLIYIAAITALLIYSHVTAARERARLLDRIQTPDPFVRKAVEDKHDTHTVNIQMPQPDIEQLTAIKTPDDQDIAAARNTYERLLNGQP